MDLSRILIYYKRPSINYVVSVGGRGVAPKTIYYIAGTTLEGG